MPNDFQNLMQSATRLTRQGDLSAATAAIQAALAGGPLQPVSARAVPTPDRQNHQSHPNVRVIKLAAPELLDIAQAEAPATAKPQGKKTPSDEQFIAGSYGAGAMNRGGYKLYIPPGAGERALPLLVMLHGCTQNPDDFAAGTAMNSLARAQGLYVLYPAQCAKANPQRCWNWFKHNHQSRGQGEPALIAGMTQAVLRAHLIDSDRVYVAGLSAGGAMAAILGECYPDIFAAVGVHSGLATGVASDLSSALAAMKGVDQKVQTRASGVATIVFHGDADSTVHKSNASQVIAACAGHAATVEVKQLKASGIRTTTRSTYSDANGAVIAEQWLVQGAAHAWSGGSVNGSYTDSLGPDASSEMLRFFRQHPRHARHGGSR